MCDPAVGPSGDSGWSDNVLIMRVAGQRHSMHTFDTFAM